MRLQVAVLAAFITLSAAAGAARAAQTTATMNVTVAKTIAVRAPKATLTLEIADTYASREHGLMNRTALAPRSGMIFVFPAEGRQMFWMKNTLIPLDMVFVASDGTITSIAPDVPASTLETPDDAVAQRSGECRYVIELAAGEAKLAGLRRGEKLALPRLATRG